MYSSPYNPQRYYQLLHQHQEAQLFFTAVRLNIFSHLDTPVAAAELADFLHYDKKKTELLLLSLTSCGLLNKAGDLYCNTPESKTFLSQSSELFLGESLLFRKQMTSLDDLEAKLKPQVPQNSKTYDFVSLAKAAVPELYAGRVQRFIGEMEKVFSTPGQPLTMLDLGGGSGILAIEFTNHFPGSHATVFESPEVASFTEETIKMHQAEKNTTVVSGDFNTDNLGGPYNLIVASGILPFVKENMAVFFRKLAAALEDGGYLLIIGQQQDTDSTVPADMPAWLSGFLDGLPLPRGKKETDNALREAGLQTADIQQQGMFTGQLYRKETDSCSVCAEDVVRSFIELTEQTANSKTNVLSFGDKDMTFYRGEIHMLKMIGDFPGIYSAELARKFGITRPVVHKTLEKLEKRLLITKKADDQDKKRFRIYLTEKGKKSYRFHQQYHETNDKALFDCLEGMSGGQLSAINYFLEQAAALIHNHA